MFKWIIVIGMAWLLRSEMQHRSSSHHNSFCVERNSAPSKPIRTTQLSHILIRARRAALVALLSILDPPTALKSQTPCRLATSYCCCQQPCHTNTQAKPPSSSTPPPAPTNTRHATAPTSEAASPLRHHVYNRRPKGYSYHDWRTYRRMDNQGGVLTCGQLTDAHNVWRLLLAHDAPRACSRDCPRTPPPPILVPQRLLSIWECENSESSTRILVVRMPSLSAPHNHTAALQQVMFVCVYLTYSRRYDECSCSVCRGLRQLLLVSPDIIIPISLTNPPSI